MKVANPHTSDIKSKIESALDSNKSNEKTELESGGVKREGCQSWRKIRYIPYASHHILNFHFECVSRRVQCKESIISEIQSANDIPSISFNSSITSSKTSLVAASSPRVDCIENLPDDKIWQVMTESAIKTLDKVSEEKDAMQPECSNGFRAKSSWTKLEI